MPRKQSLNVQASSYEPAYSEQASYIEEFIGQYKTLYESGCKRRIALYHLYALEHLCTHAESRGLDCRWIYTAFVKELDSKQTTIISRYYVGGFIAVLTDYDCDKAAAIKATAEWLGKATSPSKIRDYYKDFLSINGNWAPLNLNTIVRSRALELAAAVINGIQKPFPSNKYDQSAQIAFAKLQEAIKSAGLQETKCPVKIKLGNN